jgi:hypothetical protein
MLEQFLGLIFNVIDSYIMDTDLYIMDTDFFLIIFK